MGKNAHNTHTTCNCTSFTTHNKKTTLHKYPSHTHTHTHTHTHVRYPLADVLGDRVGVLLEPEGRLPGLGERSRLMPDPSTVLDTHTYINIYIYIYIFINTHTHTRYMYQYVYSHINIVHKITGTHMHTHTNTHTSTTHTHALTFLLEKPL
jgi:hypothetical protein